MLECRNRPNQGIWAQHSEVILKLSGLDCLTTERILILDRASLNCRPLCAYIGLIQTCNFSIRLDFHDAILLQSLRIVDESI